MRTNGYGTYHGKSKLRTFLMVFIIFLVLVLVLAVAGFFFLQQYIVHTADGLRLELPILQSEESPTPSPTASMDLVVVTPPPTPTATPAPQIRQALFLSAAAFSDGTAAAALKAAGADAAVFNMKADSGDLGYASDLPLALAAKTSSETAGINEKIKAFNASARYSVARVSCFKDHKTAGADESLPIRTNSGYRWSDPQNLRWTSPAAQTARAYLAEVCKELAALEFDEIVLDNAGYPTTGNLGYIKPGAAYNRAELDSVVGGFYEEIRAALADTGVTLTIVADETAITGEDTHSGQTPKNLAENAEKVWTALPQGENAQSLTPYPAEPPLAGKVYFWSTSPQTKGTE
ncbi:MAG: putative glycoside hydrolase [Oscillospiraceae bacterium]